MLYRNEIFHTYSPETLAVAGAAFDRAYASVSKRMDGDGNAKQTLALIIFRLVEDGGLDSGRLAELAVREWLDADRSAIVQANVDRPANLMEIDIEPVQRAALIGILADGD